MENDHASSPGIASVLGLAGTATVRVALWRRPLVWVIAAALAIGVAALVYVKRAAPPIRYSMVQARRGDLSVTVTATGTLAPLDTVVVGTEVSGVVDSVLVDYNDRVRKGQSLAVVNTDILRAQIEQSAAAVTAAEATAQQSAATLAQARIQHERVVALVGQLVLTQQDLDTANGDFARIAAADSVTRAQIAVAAAALKQQTTTLGKATIRAPIDGIVLERQIDPGRTVAATFQTPVLFVLAADLTRMTLELNVDEADIGQVKKGQSAQFTVDAYPDRVFTAAVRTVYNAAIMVEGVVTYQAILDVTNADLALRPGMTATATVNTTTVHNALLVPNAALRFTPAAAPGQETGGVTAANAATHRVWMDSGGRLLAVPLRIGLSDGQWTEVTGGGVVSGTPLVVGILLGQPEGKQGSSPPRPDSSHSAMPLRMPRGG